ncbi:MAG: hypothetical protein RL722_2771, partial [Pseudomonadota bacterium]
MTAHRTLPPACTMRLPFLNRPPASPRPASHRSSGQVDTRPSADRSGQDTQGGEANRHRDSAAGERRGTDRRGARTRSAQEAVQARTRRAQFGALMRNLPVSLGGMLVLATATVMVSQGHIDQTLMLGWLIALATLSLTGMQAAWRWRQTEADQRRVSTSQLRLVSGLAGVVGALWGSLPALLFLRAEAGAQSMVAPLLIGVLGGGCITLAALPPALASFAATLSAGTLLMLSLSLDDSARYTLLAWVVFVAMGATGALAHA